MKILIDEQVVQQALGAFNNYTQVCSSVNDPGTWTPKIKDEGGPAREAITALRAALDAAEQDNQRISELESVIKSHGIPVKTYSGGVAHYCTGIYDAKDEV